MDFSSYGELGYSIMHQSIQSLFPAVKMVPSLFKPLTWISFLQRILIPETALLLIMEDLKLKEKRDSKRLSRSCRKVQSMGQECFPDNDEEEEDCMTVGDKIVMKRALEAAKKHSG